MTTATVSRQRAIGAFDLTPDLARMAVHDVAPRVQ